jgi:glycosyltransferase involved in cell wall biosynthesis
MPATYSERSVEPVTERPALAAADQRPARLLYLRDTLTVCGPGKTILNTWKTIDRNRYQLTIVATRPEPGGRNALIDAALAQHATAIPMPIGRGIDVIAVARVVRLLREHRIDVLQTHDAQTRRIGVIAAALTGVRHITSVHGWIFNDRKERAAKWLDARLIRQADAVIAVSDRLKQELEAAGVPPQRITVLRNAILLRDYAIAGTAASVRREFGIRDDQPVISIVGRLSLEKGHETFLQAASTIAKTHPDLRCLIVGDGPLEHMLRQRVQELGLTTQVVFTGHRSQLADIYAATDVLVISSLTEGIPNVLLEAFAHGKPAVATSVGGVPEVLENGRTGWLVEVGDYQAIARHVVRLLDAPELRAQMGAAARATIEQQFSFENRTKALETLYDRITHAR